MSEMGSSPFPGYNGNASGSGGSQIGVIAPGKTDAQIEASWEFMKFMLEDENVVYFTENTGFLGKLRKTGWSNRQCRHII